MKHIIVTLFITCGLISSFAQNGPLETKKQAVTLSAIKGEKSKIDTLLVFNKGNTIDGINLQIEGLYSDFFKIAQALPKQLKAKDSIAILIQFQPDAEFVGLINANLIVRNAKNELLKLPLHAISSNGLEGKNEPALSWVIKTLGYAVDLGWETLANHIRPDLQGDELPQSLFKKSGKHAVEMIPLARYSPAFELPFGYYTVGDSLPILNEVGVLADSKSYHEHQTLFPKIERGGSSFVPKSEPFGFYTTSTSHIAYSEDAWNMKLFKKNAAHACRIYPIKDAQGIVLPNQFLVCFEEAFNGDYQDYVFLVKHVEIVNKEK